MKSVARGRQRDGKTDDVTETREVVFSSMDEITTASSFSSDRVAGPTDTLSVD